jgi:hypothetical protein
MSHLKPMLNAQYKTTAAAPDLRVRGTGACSLAGAGMRNTQVFAVCIQPAGSGVNASNKAT